MIFSDVVPPAPDGAGAAADHEEDSHGADSEDQHWGGDYWYYVKVKPNFMYLLLETFHVRKCNPR